MTKKGMVYLAGMFAAALAVSAGAWAVTDETLEMKAAARQDAQDKAAVEPGPPGQGNTDPAIDPDERTGPPGQGNTDPAIDPAPQTTPVERYRPVVQAADALAALAARSSSGPDSDAVDNILRKRIEPALKRAAFDSGLEGGKALRGYQVVEEAAKFDCQLRQRSGGSAAAQDLQDPQLYYESECVAAYAQRLRLSTPPSVRAELKAEAAAH